MIGGGAFLLLKTGSNGPESSEQAEIPLAGSATILAFGFWWVPEGPWHDSREGLKTAFSG